MWSDTQIEFLNTDKLREWIPRLITESQNELVIIVPYIKTSDRLYSALKEADQRGVHTTIIYREEKLRGIEKQKLIDLDNLNLMCHPNIHAKCFMNEQHLLITSINMYEYSELNNREMGILLLKESAQKVVEDAIIEINHIITGATLEEKSRMAREGGFQMEITKTLKEREEDKCARINEIFEHKKFKVEKAGEQTYISICRNYHDRINVIMDRRIMINLEYDNTRKAEIYERFKPDNHEFRFPGYKLYWNYYTQSIYLYADSRHNMWNHPENETALFKEGIDKVIAVLRKCIH